MLCTGSLPGEPTFVPGPGVRVVTSRDVLAGAATGRVARQEPAGSGDPTGSGPANPADRPDEAPVAGPGDSTVVWDPLGGPEAVAVAELLQAEAGRSAPVVLVTPDMVVGQQLSRTGDLAPANSRLQAAGVTLVRHGVLRRCGDGTAEIEDRFGGHRQAVPAAVVVDAGARLPDDRLWRETGGRHHRAGDAVAPRTVGEAILEGRRAALAVLHATVVPAGIGPAPAGGPAHSATAAGSDTAPPSGKPASGSKPVSGSKPARASKPAHGAKPAHGGRAER